MPGNIPVLQEKFHTLTPHSNYAKEIPPCLAALKRCSDLRLSEPRIPHALYCLAHNLRPPSPSLSTPSVMHRNFC